MDCYKRKILLVEDEVLIAMLEKLELEKLGYSITHVTNGEEAIRQVLNNGHVFDVILMDIDLGSGIDGTQAAEKILKFMDTPIVFLSSHTESEIVEKTEKITSYGYVVKNSGFVILDASIKMALRLFNEKQERKMAEKELIKSQLITENIPVGLYLYHLEDLEDDRTLRMIYANPAVKHLTGIGPEEIIGKTIDENFPNLRSNEIPRKFADVVRKNQPVFFEDMVYSDNRIIQSVFSVQAFPLPGNHVGVVFDNITEQKRAAEELRESRNMLDTILNTIPQSVFWKDRNSKYLGCNTQFANAVGLQNHCDIVGKTDFDLPWPKEEAEAYLDDDRFVMDNNCPKSNIIEPLEQADGKKLWIDTTKKPLLDDKGKVYGVLGVYENITDRKRAEEEIQRQLTEKETILREVNHRIKNNMASVESLLLLQAGSTSSPEAKAVLQDSISRVKSTRILYNKLLLTKDYQDISLKLYIESLIDSINAVFVIGKNITINKQITDFTIDSKRAVSIGIIVNELLTNVFKYAFTERDNGIVSISINKTENNATLIIQDNGIGIDEKISLNNSSGLGLTIVRMLVEQLKGTYDIINENGTKSTVKFEI